MNPKVTVYIASKNYGRYLEEAIESVLNQTMDNWELLLIDDASDDNTYEIMCRYQAHSKISVFQTEGIGLPAVNNLALENAKGDYFVRLDGDDTFDENFLLVLSNLLDKDPELALVFPDYYLVDEGGRIFAHERRAKLFKDDHLMDLPPNGACTMVRTQVLRDLGGYRMDLGAQDGLDLWVKLRELYKATNVNLPLFFYRRHGSNLTEQPMRIVNARRALKKSATLDKLNSCRPILAVIPCRKNYDCVPDLWNQKMGDKTLLERDIEACLESEIIDQVVVACDNPDSEKIVESYKNEKVKFFLRSEQSTRISVSIVETLKSIAEKFDPSFNGITLMRYVQTPFVSTGTIDEAITSLSLGDADSACAVEQIDSKIYKRTPYGLLPMNTDYGALVGTETLFRDASTVTALKNQNLVKGSLTGSKVAGFVVSTAESFFISTQHELEIAQALEVKKKQLNNSFPNSHSIQHQGSIM